MSNSNTTFIKNALEYYDRNSEKLRKKFNNVHNYEVILNSRDSEHSVIYFYDKNKKKLFTSRFEIIGTYIETLKVWAWAWTLPTINKNAAYMSRKLLMYGLDLDYQSDGKNLKTELITSRFHIKNKIQIDLHLAIAAYLTKTPFIYSINQDTSTYDTETQSFGQHYFIFLLDIKDQD